MTAGNRFPACATAIRLYAWSSENPSSLTQNVNMPCFLNREAVPFRPGTGRDASADVGAAPNPSTSTSGGAISGPFLRRPPQIPARHRPVRSPLLADRQQLL